MSAKSHFASDFCVGSWIVRPSLSRIERGDVAAHLTPRAMSVLVHLGAARGAVVARNELLDAVWPRMAVSADALTQCVAELRRAFGDDAKHPHILETIPRVGLRLVPPVGPLEAAPAPAVAAAPHAARALQWQPWAAAFGTAAMVVAVTLSLALTRLAPPADPPASMTNSAEAYELYVTARHFRERGDFHRAALYAQQAVAADPNFALAHATLAAGLTYQDPSFSDPEKRARADAASQRAIELDASSAEALALRANILWELGDLAGAERYAARALEIDPFDPQAQQTNAFLLMSAGRPDEALELMMSARGRDPLSPIGRAMVGQWQYLAGQTDAAIESLERALELAPEHTGARRALALAYFRSGRERDAIEQYLRLPIPEAMKNELRASLAPDAPRGVRLNINQEQGAAYCQHNGLMAAEVFAHYSAAEPMIGCLREAVAETPYPDFTLGFWMKANPVFAAYRSDERFAEVLRASGLPH